MLRKILAVVAAVFAGGILVSVVQSIGHSMYPLPAGADPNDMEDMKKYVESAPFMALFFVILSYAAGALTGGFVSTIIANDGKKTYAIITGIIFVIFSVIMMSSLPTPIWFWIMGILVWLLVLAGWKLAVLLRKK